MADVSDVPEDRLLTLDEAYRAAFHFVLQYYKRERIVPFMLMLSSMHPWTPGGDPRITSDPATWNDWLLSVQAALQSQELPEMPPPD